MSIAATGTFGSGGAEPYARALRFDDHVLYLRDSAQPTAAPSFTMDVSRWNDDANEADLSVFDGSSGPVLDIGCGPGRMVKAAIGMGLSALGVDVSSAAVEIAATAGLPVLRRSIFDRVPREGEWQTALLIDGNIGIGGNAVVLLRRCRALLAPTGTVVVEVHQDPVRDYEYQGTVVDIRGHESDNFPWAEIGQDALALKARTAGLHVTQVWESSGRAFCRLAVTPREMR